MTNRESIIDLLQRNSYEDDSIVASYIECPYCDGCTNPHEYGTTDFQMYCDDCKIEWLDKET